MLKVILMLITLFIHREVHLTGSSLLTVASSHLDQVEVNLRCSARPQTDQQMETDNIQEHTNTHSRDSSIYTRLCLSLCGNPSSGWLAAYFTWRREMIRARLSWTQKRTGGRGGRPWQHEDWKSESEEGASPEVFQTVTALHLWADVCGKLPHQLVVMHSPLINSLCSLCLVHYSSQLRPHFLLNRKLSQVLRVSQGPAGGCLRT